MVEELVADFLQYLRFEKRFSSHTLIAYHTDLSQFTDYLAAQFSVHDVQAVAHYHVRSWLVSLKDENMSARSINRKLSSLQSFYKFLIRRQKISVNPLRQSHALKLPERLPVYAKEQDMSKLLDDVVFDKGFKGQTDRMICELLYMTGIRRQELVQLKERDIEWSLGHIRILGKGGKERLVPAVGELFQNLRIYIEEKRKLSGADATHLLVLESGKPLYAGYVYRVVKHYLGETDTTLSKRSPHVLRHTFATHLMNKGANIQAIKDLLGHSSLAATQVYTHNNIEKLKEVHKLNHPRG